MSGERVIYGSEVIRLFQRHKLSVFCGGLISFIAIFLLVLWLSHPNFQAQATFRQAQSHSEDNSSLQSILKTMHISDEGISALSVMQSKRLLSEVIQRAGLQFVPLEESKCRTLLFAELKVRQEEHPFVFRDVQFEGERTELVFLRPLTKEVFELLDQKKRKIGRGRLNQPFHFDAGTFTLEKMSTKPKLFGFKLIPKREACCILQKNLKIKTSRLDRHVIKLSCTHRCRQVALNTLNCLMERFQHYLKAEHEELSASQVRYLQKRRDQLGRDFDKALAEHVVYLQNSLGVEGFLGLVQEIEMLSKPKEKYTAKKHELDLEHKRWYQTRLEATADHPWREGKRKMDQLQWDQEQLISGSSIPSEFMGIDLETAQLLHTEYTRELDQIASQINTLEAFLKKVAQPDFELSALSQILTDEVSQKIIQKGADSAFQFVDKHNRSEKELKRLESVILTQKEFLKEHMTKKIELLQIRIDLIEEKIGQLKHTALELVEKEKKHVEQKLSEIAQKMGDLPEKWRLESQLKLKKELTMQIIEGLTQLSESKVVNHHLFHVESKPLDFADAPLYIQRPHLFLLSGIGGIVGAVFFFLVLFFSMAQRGLPISAEYLRDRKIPFIRNQKMQETLQRIALEIKPGEVIALIGSQLSTNLADFLAQTGRKTLLLELGEEKEPHLAGRHALCTLPTLFQQQLPEKLDCWKKRYECILVAIPDLPSSPEALRTTALADRFILELKEERQEHLTPFESKKILCLLTV